MQSEIKTEMQLPSKIMSLQVLPLFPAEMYEQSLHTMFILLPVSFGNNLKHLKTVIIPVCFSCDKLTEALLDSVF